MSARFLLLVLVAGCVAPCQTTTHVVTRTVPYVALVLQDTADHGALGRSGCDQTGQPYRSISAWAPILLVPWIVLHEDIHVEQMRAHKGGCIGFAIEYNTNPAAKLHYEAEAYCGVFTAQTSVGMTPDPSLHSIVRRLQATYHEDWDEDEIHAAMTCWKPPTPRIR